MFSIDIFGVDLSQLILKNSYVVHDKIKCKLKKQKSKQIDLPIALIVKGVYDNSKFLMFQIELMSE